MLDHKFIEQNIEIVEQKLKKRGIDLETDQLNELFTNRKKIIQQVENLESERNKGSKKIGQLKRAGKTDELNELMSSLKTISDEVKTLNEKRSVAESDLRDFLLQIPNLPDDSVPEGFDETCNVEVRKWGEPRNFDFDFSDHVEIGEQLEILDLKRATKIAGSRFALYRGMGARLERALINFMIDIHVNEHGYTEILPPFVANQESFIGTGNLPKFEDDLFRLKDTDYFLVPTAEVPVTNIHRDEILDFEALPVKYVAYTPCFRKEAGSYGKDVHGIMRQHQFNKVELVKFSKPEDSFDELESLTKDASKILELLELPYRVVSLCGGDLGFSSAKTYDLEVWIPSENRYREISSCSNFENFQARRANIRYRPFKQSKPAFLHTLNGSGVAVGRAVIAILENFQREDGKVEIPDVLVDYMNGQKIIG